MSKLELGWVARLALALAAGCNAADARPENGAGDDPRSAQDGGAVQLRTTTTRR